ncbi:hypothetical protein [Parahaliea maris]|uniref:hypothetical protein n=1 Tax=Parahaliea maris TaxID=2716870 RepID=UPI001650A7D5|nr:hypothetical protein [Parahaliea maris]
MMAASVGCLNRRGSHGYLGVLGKVSLNDQVHAIAIVEVTLRVGECGEAVVGDVPRIGRAVALGLELRADFVEADHIIQRIVLGTEAVVWHGLVAGQSIKRKTQIKRSGFSNET